MYCLSDKQIDYIINDISARGVEMESLQQDLLDHVCCIIEQGLEENGDFERFYKKTIKTFYKDELWEIEEETLLLLTFKNYYVMKKTMIISGTIAALSFIFGSVFKTMYWPGANVLILFAMLCSSLVFLPLFFLFKTKQTTEKKNKVILMVGTLNGILFCISSLFRIMHWPGSQALWLLTLALLVLVFIPLFFFNGIKNPETKTNTIATTLILIMVGGFFYSLTSLRSSKHVYTSKMYNYLAIEELISRMHTDQKDSLPKNKELAKLTSEIDATCNKIKTMIIEDAIGEKAMPEDFEAKNIYLQEGGIGVEFTPCQPGYDLVVDLKYQIAKYNSHISDTKMRVPVQNTLLRMLDKDLVAYSNYNLLSVITQIQLFVLQNKA